MSYGVGCRYGSDPALLWLWRRLVATVPIGPLAWEPPYAEGAALKKKKKKLRQDRWFQVALPHTAPWGQAPVHVVRAGSSPPLPPHSLLRKWGQGG